MAILDAKSPRFNSQNVQATQAGLDRLEREGALAVVDPKLQSFLAYAAELQQRLVTPAAVDLEDDRHTLAAGCPNHVESAGLFELPMARLDLCAGNMAKIGT